MQTHTKVEIDMALSPTQRMDQIKPIIHQIPGFMLIMNNSGAICKFFIVYFCSSECSAFSECTEFL